MYGSSNFIEDLNNTKGNRPEYKEKILALKHFGVYWFEDDTQMQPKESQWFGYQTNYSRLLPLRFQKEYADDVLGLKELHETGRLKFHKGIGDHMHVHEYQVVDYLAPLLLDEEEHPSDLVYHRSYENVTVDPSKK